MNAKTISIVIILVFNLLVYWWNSDFIREYKIKNEKFRMKPHKALKAVLIINMLGLIAAMLYPAAL